jgi:hypothetical protein
MEERTYKKEVCKYQHPRMQITMQTYEQMCVCAGFGNYMVADVSIDCEGFYVTSESASGWVDISDVDLDGCLITSLDEVVCP